MYNYAAQGRMSFDRRPDANPAGEDKAHLDTPLDNADTNRKLAELLTLWVLF
ncbi:hypothetical protein HFO74_27455 [Rhizobium laguerreae]|uniref:Uncharacterized protein n=2 Tax=Rhizobium laguerreae TaxID=1076926 RepID=A0AB35FN85_9HYPH|nr:MULTISPECIES: hypothetical protein [Rhizobium]MBY3067113.1 hypothetical protein [Rhizobium laguerreae]MBY3080111.1 hypothetical protein [Rhizobium laguerreae]MBY3114432.1 hypothetical protein [Rhizobium laguerreae]MBY3245208.1 hypothetical protein [Rhizobium laguerreae]MBY3256005.1 hypothetical protein [Rhizobium laguerreae]